MLRVPLGIEKSPQLVCIFTRTHETLLVEGLLDGKMIERLGVQHTLHRGSSTIIQHAVRYITTAVLQLYMRPLIVVDYVLTIEVRIIGNDTENQ